MDVQPIIIKEETHEIIIKEETHEIIIKQENNINDHDDPQEEKVNLAQLRKCIALSTEFDEEMTHEEWQNNRFFVNPALVEYQSKYHIFCMFLWFLSNN